MFQIILNRRHCILCNNRNTVFTWYHIGRCHAIRKIPFTGIKQQAELRTVLLKYFLKLFIGQQLFFLYFCVVQFCKMLLKMLYKLPCRIPRYVHNHHVYGFGFRFNHVSNCADNQLLLKNQHKLPSLFFPRDVNEAVINAVAKLFAAIAVADKLGIELKHRIETADYCLPHHCLLLIRQKIFPLFHGFAAYNCMILNRGVPN